VRFIMSDMQGQTIADHTLSDPLSDFCFTELPATIYRVVAELPAGYVATTQPRWSVSLTGDATVGIQLGVRVDTASQSTSISPAWLLGAGGLMIAAMAGVWFWQRRK
jgi:hypothetical protein